MKKLSNKAKLLAVGAIAAAVAVVVAVIPKGSKDQDVCSTVHMANPGWSDVAITVDWLSTLFSALGYTPKETTVSTAVSFASLKNKDIDIMLANWLPADDELMAQYKGDYDVLGTNLKDVPYTLATTPTAYAAGLKSWQDIPKFEKELGGKIYGIEPGSAGNTIVMKFTQDVGIDKTFRVIEASTVAMLAEVEKNLDGFIVYLAWDPHWMSKYEPQFLSGGEEWMGTNSQVVTLGRKDYRADCPNVARFFDNFEQDIPELNNVIVEVKDGTPLNQAATAWLEANPDAVKKWMKGVKTIDGGNGWAAASEALGY
ncbi:MAG: glycine betaine ABC transporter substrate-binding protein [Alphaproteobacteria bacterium]